jgi:hypothetical protein
MLIINKKGYLKKKYFKISLIENTSTKILYIILSNIHLGFIWQHDTP